MWAKAAVFLHEKSRLTIPISIVKEFYKRIRAVLDASRFLFGMDDSFLQLVLFWDGPVKTVILYAPFVQAGITVLVFWISG